MERWPGGTKVSRARGARVLSWLLFWIPVLLLCGWVLSLPVFPSQDGPLHLYYVNVLRQLLLHQPGAYADTYTVKSLVTPYSAYYYGLLALNRFMSLDTADKVLVCVAIVGFAAACRMLLRVISSESGLSSFLILPVVMSWPLLMGFVNYTLSTCLAIAAIAVWCSGLERPGLRSRTLFLVLIACITVTHPVPWLFTVSFVLLELALRVLRHLSPRFREGARPSMRFLRRDAITAAIACLPYLFIRHFGQTVQTLEPSHVEPDPALARVLSPSLLSIVERALDYLKTLGIDVFATDGMWTQVYRIGIRMALIGCLAAGICAFAVRYRQGRWSLADNFTAFGLVLVPVLLFLPDPFQGRYFFAARMGIVLYVASVAATSPLLRSREWIARSAAGFGFCMWMLTLGLAAHYITPQARNIATLRKAPEVTGPHTGLTMVAVGNGTTDGLTFLPDNWATAHYYRWHNLVLYNTAWLGDPIIMVGVKPQALSRVDSTYFESVPWFRSRMLPDESAMRATLAKVGFVILMRQNASPKEHPFAEEDDQTKPGPFARGWTCIHAPERAWYLCQRQSALRPETTQSGSGGL